MRLDQALAARGLTRSRAKGQQAVANGFVLVNGTVASKPSLDVGDDDVLEITQPDEYVSRGAYKLLGALEDSGVQVRGRVLDAGASHGGFTQVCLERGAERVYAVDVGHGQLVDFLRDDPRVAVRERLNLRELTLSDLDEEPVDLAVGDVSFISLKLVLEQILGVLAPGGEALLLVKPQFEVGRSGLNSKGVVKNEELRQSALAGVVAAARELGWEAIWTGDSRVPGEHGNREFFVHLRRER
ncbi:MAG: TlyA family RNA methyltransferase [Propionibacteriaceae bacterium]|jgi:23S rRNA (cytidine1920-2'-O)/16S rRNA (cytidine1409-2'-O)-methyltransferase|nr:TlyA family RNA methyltransferase [Propionibacteriaceae bacterium]